MRARVGKMAYSVESRWGETVEQLEKAERLYREVLAEGAQRTAGVSSDSGKVMYALRTVNGITYIEADKSIFRRDDGSELSQREVFDALEGTVIPLPDGNVKIIKRLPDKDMYNELFRSVGILENGEKIAYAKKYYGYDAELTKKIQTAEATSEKSRLNQQPVSKCRIPQPDTSVKSKNSTDGRGWVYGRAFGQKGRQFSGYVL